LLHTLRETTVRTKLVDTPGGFLLELLCHRGRGISGLARFQEQPD
jgi:hypothetical protein